jgi:hypothetical protein
VQVQSRIEIEMEVRVDSVQPSSSLSKGEVEVGRGCVKGGNDADRVMRLAWLDYIPMTISATDV